MLLTLVVPLGVMLRDSLNRFDPSEMMIAAVTPENYLRFFVDPFYRSVLYTTIRVSIIEKPRRRRWGAIWEKLWALQMRRGA